MNVYILDGIEFWGYVCLIQLSGTIHHKPQNKPILKLFNPR